MQAMTDGRRRGSLAPPVWRTGPRGRFAELFNGRDNGFGALRLGLALSVVVAHATSLGFGWEDLGLTAFQGQTNVGTLAVFGFFVLSGLLITRSARRTSVGRFAWHRALRILPGLWVCLLVTAFVVAPLVTLREHGDLAGFWAGPHGPLQYVWHNWFAGVRQYGIHDLFAESTPWGRQTGSSVVDGALWSLVYEMACYTLVAVFAVTAVLRRRRWLVLAIAVVLYGFIVADQVQSRELFGPPATHYGSVHVPLLGAVYPHWLIYLGFLFLAGALFDLYGDRIPVHDWLGVGAAAVLVASLLVGGFFVAGFPALGYVLVWLSVRMPRRLRWIGRRNDYSYGIYIYGFVGQQVFASLGWSRWGFWPYTAMSVAAAFAAAALSWHLVEKHALRCKDWSPRKVGRVREAVPSGAPGSVAGREPSGATGSVAGREPGAVGTGAGGRPGRGGAHRSGHAVPAGIRTSSPEGARRRRAAAKNGSAKADRAAEARNDAG